ncbi:MAG: GAF domain-containing protein, partial [Thermodesulfobacteriota bacterium]|nr:GAF domain-containing protein [Thermodesulfobacteriota bacterium]
MVYDERLIKFIVNRPLKLSPVVIKRKAAVIPHLFQASLLVDLEMDPERISEIFFNIIQQLTSFDMALLYMWNSSETWFCRGIKGAVPDSIDGGNIFTHNIRHTAKPMLIPDIMQSVLDPEELPFTFSSMMGVPIYLDTRTIGCLELYRKKGNPFDTDELILIKHLLIYSEDVLKGLSVIDTLTDKDPKVRIDMPRKDVIPNILHQYSEQAKRLLYPLSIAVITIKDPSKLILSDIPSEGLKPLNAISKELREALRCYDNVLQYEETSFLVILPGCSSDDAIATLKKAISALTHESADNLVVGLATLPEEAQDARGLMNGALQALSYAKKNDS